MKRFTTSIFLVYLVVHCTAQTNTYKKILSEKAGVDRETFFQNLKNFKEENSQFANVYYQMGKVELEIFSGLDPITERLTSRHRIYNAKVNFGLAKTFLDPKEITRFPEWYDVASSNKDSITILGQQQIDESYANTELFSDAYEQLLVNYDKAVQNYLSAREAFIGINTSAESLRELFLQTDEELKQSVKQVGTYFDSCLFYLGQYREIYQQLPHYDKRAVNVNLKRIDHFRMNGITPVNFLADDINLWDYGQWSTRFLELLEVEVDGLKEEIRVAFDYFISTNNRLINGEECIQAEVDERKFQRVINLITKYDQQSVLIDIFRYFLTKLEYGNQLVYERNCNQLEPALSDDFLSRKARINQNLYRAYLKTDSLNLSISNGSSSEDSFSWFFQEKMQGQGGSLRFSEAQSRQNASTIKGELEDFQMSIKRQFFQVDSTLDLTYEIQDSLLVFTRDSVENYFTMGSKLQLNDTLTLLRGTVGVKQKLIAAAPMELDYEEYWEVVPENGKVLEFFKVVGDSSFVTGGVAGGGWLHQYHFNGEKLLSVRLAKEGAILNVSVNNLTNRLTITQLLDKQLTISELDFAGKPTKSIETELSGEYIGMFKHEQSFHLFTTDSKETVSMQVIGADGSVTDSKKYAYNSVLIAPRIVKNDDQWITLISESPYTDRDLIYSLLDYEGNVRFERAF